MSIFQKSSAPFSEIEQCLNRISGPLGFLDGNLGERLIARMFRLAMHRGTNFDRAIAIMRCALVLSYSPARSRKLPLHWIRLARKLARNSGSQNARALAHVSMFLWHSLQGRFNTSLRYARRAERLYEAQYASDTWETGFVCWICLAHLWYLGRLQELCDKTLAYRQDATQRTDTMWMYWMHVNAAHLADLVRDDVAAGSRALISAGAVLSDNVFETPQLVLWVSQVRQILYEGDARRARQKLLDEWSKVEASRFTKVGYYNWLVRYLRIICNLACVAEDPAERALYVRDSRRQLKRLLKLPQPTFLVYADALKLVVEAAAGNVAPSADWQAVLQAARQQQLGLLVVAIQWHAEHWHPTGFLSAARQRLRDEGCVNPERLMTIILPLPHVQV